MKYMYKNTLTLIVIYTMFVIKPTDNYTNIRTISLTEYDQTITLFHESHARLYMKL